MKSVTVFMGLVLWGLTAQGAADILVVKPDGTGDYPTIQAAVDAAANGDVIELADGVFVGDGNRDIDVSGKQITVRSQGGPEACVIDCQGGPSDRHRGFYFHGYYWGGKAVLEGMTITNGYALQGGAINCLGASHTIADCIFLLNTAIGEGGRSVAILTRSPRSLGACSAQTWQPTGAGPRSAIRPTPSLSAAPSLETGPRGKGEGCDCEGRTVHWCSALSMGMSLQSEGGLPGVCSGSFCWRTRSSRSVPGARPWLAGENSLGSPAVISTAMRAGTGRTRSRASMGRKATSPRTHCSVTPRAAT